MKNSPGKLIISAFTAGILLISTSAYSAPAANKPLGKSDIEEIVKQTIKDNPALILESVNDYQKKKQAELSSKASQNIISMQDQLKNDPNSPAIGNPTGDVTIIEFFDYHCGYCKQFLPTVTKLLDDDNKLRLVFKEFPILSEDSELAAKAALAVNKIDKNKYMTFHTALMKMSTSFTMETLTATAKEIGIDADTFKKTLSDPSIETELTKNKELAYSLDIHGTPAIIIGTDVVPGAISINELKAKIAATRAKK